MKRGITLLALVVLPGGTARADTGLFSASEVTSWCQPYRTAVLNEDHISVQGTAESQACFGAFVAIQQLGATTSGRTATKSLLGMCLPPESRTIDLIKVFLRYSDEHPEQGHYRFT